MHNLSFVLVEYNIKLQLELLKISWICNISFQIAKVYEDYPDYKQAVIIKFS